MILCNLLKKKRGWKNLKDKQDNQPRIIISLAFHNYDCLNFSSMTHECIRSTFPFFPFRILLGHYYPWPTHFQTNF